MGNVNTFLIGAQKAGTTSLYDWLGQHPDIFAPEELKDFHCFTNPKLFNKGIKYLERFYESNQKVKLHSAVNYLYFSDVAAQRLHEYNQKAKIIICLRNPVDRAISAYRYFTRTLEEKFTFEEAINREENEKLHTYTELANHSYIAHGKYLKQIQTFLRYFPAKQIHFVFFEELTDKKLQGEVMKGILMFLELNPNFSFRYRHLNFSGQPKSKLLNLIIKKSGISKIIKVFLPFWFRKKIAKQIEQKNISSRQINVEVPAAIKERIHQICFQDIEELSLITGRDLYNLWPRIMTDKK